ncbi:MAG: glycosyltransferase family 2 protein [Planctomycetota bacterium]
MRTAEDSPLAIDQRAPVADGLITLMAGPEAAPPAAATPSATLPPVRATPARRVRDVTIVIPARNESANLARLLAEVSTVLAPLRAAGMVFQVLVVDDGSSDATASLAAAGGAEVVQHAVSLGNGAAVKRGIRHAHCSWILLLDGDGQHPPASIPAMLDLAERFDMVVGSRGGRGGSAHRNIANRIYNRLASYVTSRRIDDLTSGFRLVRADVLKSFVYLLPNTFSYPTTITLAMLRAGYSVAFQPIEVRQRGGKSHIRLLRDGSRFLVIILRIATFFAPLRVFGPLAAAMFALGVGWYGYTFISSGRFTNMALLLVAQATMLFALGLVSEQIAAMRFERAPVRDSD